MGQVKMVISCGREANTLGNPQATPTPTPKEKDKFCSSLQGISGSLKLSKRLKKEIVLSLPAATLKGERDRALLAFISFFNLRADRLVNLLVSDYNRATGVLKIPTSAT